MDIFNFKDSQDIRKAHAFVSQMWSSYRVSSVTVRYNLKVAFYRLLFAYKMVDVAQEILNLRKQNTDMVQLLYNNGQESKGNLMLSKAQTKLAQEAVDQNKRRLRLAQIQLDQLLGKDGFTQVSVQGSLDLPDPPKGYPDMASLVENNPNVQLQKAIWLGAKAGVGQSLSAMLPNVGVSYTRSTLGNTMIATQSPSWSFFGSVDIPIFSNGPLGTFFTLVSAKKTADQNEEQLRSTRLLTRATMENAWYNLKNEAQLVDVWDYRVKATKQRNDESTIRYSAGLMTYDTWEIAVTDLVNAEQTLINDQYLEAQYLAAWEQSKGLGLEDE
jgi:outer membrane protein TolC